MRAGFKPRPSSRKQKYVVQGPPMSARTLPAGGAAGRPFDHEGPDRPLTFFDDDASGALPLVLLRLSRFQDFTLARLLEIIFFPSLPVFLQTHFMMPGINNIELQYSRCTGKLVQVYCNDFDLRPWQRVKHLGILTTTVFLPQFPLKVVAVTI